MFALKGRSSRNQSLSSGASILKVVSLPSNFSSIKIAKTADSREKPFALNTSRSTRNRSVISNLPRVSSIASFQNLSSRVTADSREKHFAINAKQH